MQIFDANLPEIGSISMDLRAGKSLCCCAPLFQVYGLLRRRSLIAYFWLLCSNSSLCALYELTLARMLAAQLRTVLGTVQRTEATTEKCVAMEKKLYRNMRAWSKSHYRDVVHNWVVKFWNAKKERSVDSIRTVFLLFFIRCFDNGNTVTTNWQTLAIFLPINMYFANDWPIQDAIIFFIMFQCIRLVASAHKPHKYLTVISMFVYMPIGCTRFVHTTTWSIISLIIPWLSQQIEPH